MQLYIHSYATHTGSFIRALTLLVGQHERFLDHEKHAKINPNCYLPQLENCSRLSIEVPLTAFQTEIITVNLTFSQYTDKQISRHTGHVMPKHP